MLPPANLDYLSAINWMDVMWRSARLTVVVSSPKQRGAWYVFIQAPEDIN